MCFDVFSHCRVVAVVGIVYKIGCMSVTELCDILYCMERI